MAKKHEHGKPCHGRIPQTRDGIMASILAARKLAQYDGREAGSCDDERNSGRSALGRRKLLRKGEWRVWADQGGPRCRLQESGSQKPVATHFLRR
jgi:hypothetical protein